MRTAALHRAIFACASENRPPKWAAMVQPGLRRSIAANGVVNENVFPRRRTGRHAPPVACRRDADSPRPRLGARTAGQWRRRGRAAPLGCWAHHPSHRLSAGARLDFPHGRAAPFQAARSELRRHADSGQWPPPRLHPERSGDRARHANRPAGVGVRPEAPGQSLPELRLPPAAASPFGATAMRGPASPAAPALRWRRWTRG